MKTLEVGRLFDEMVKQKNFWKNCSDAADIKITELESELADYRGATNRTCDECIKKLLVSFDKREKELLAQIAELTELWTFNANQASKYLDDKVALSDELATLKKKTVSN